MVELLSNVGIGQGACDASGARRRNRDKLSAMPFLTPGTCLAVSVKQEHAYSGIPSRLLGD